MTIDSRIRKYKYNIKCSSRAVIGFGIWAAIRDYMLLFFSYDFFVKNVGLEVKDTFSKLVIFWIMTFVSLFDILLRVYFYKKAEKFTNEGKGGSIVIIFCLIFIIMNIFGDSSLIYSKLQENEFGEIIVHIIIEATALFALLEIIISSIQIRRLRKTAILCKETQ